MTLRDMVHVSAGNLRRLKLRTFLTVSGVVIAIGAFTTMLSLGAGNQKMIREQYEQLGLFSTVLAYPSTGDADSARALDDDAIREFAGLPGVRAAYPYDDFDVSVSYGDSTVAVRAQAIPPGANDAPLFTRLVAGTTITPDDSTGTLVLAEFLPDLGFASPEAAVGEAIVVSVRAASADSGFAYLVPDPTELRQRLEGIPPDSLGNRVFLSRFVRRELRDGTRRFFDGYLHAQRVVSDSLVIRGVLRGGDRRSNLREVVIPRRTARRFHEAGPGGEPRDLVPALMNGDLFGAEEGGDARSYAQATLLLDTYTSHVAIVDSLEARGFRAFSYAAQFDEVRRGMLFFNLALAGVGLVALATAALGIANTLTMSVTERRREIGILKALGAEDADIRLLFLVESALIGLLGSAAGVLLGWIVARIGSAIAQELMRRQSVPPFDLFSTPPWLVATSIAFGTLIAVLSGTLPAARAARVDPVRALRSD
ncbi:MAG: FtsX-like permease family protein [bacterium]